MNVRTETHVVSEVPADVIGILVDHDLVAAPIPIRYEAKVRVGHAEIKPAEPEAAGASAGEAPDVRGTEAAGEMAVRPRMIEMKAGIVAAGVVTYPDIAASGLRRRGERSDGQSRR